jgi:hypothetical protein
MEIPMRSIVFLAALLLAPPALAQVAYQPTEAESQEVAALTAKYFDLVDRMDHDASYALLAPALASQVDAAGWAKLQREARAERGAPRERVQRLLSWEADPDGAPPGLYVSVDLDSVHDVAKHMSEYVVWFRAPGTKEFRLLRHESTEMRGIVEDKSGPSPHGGGATAVGATSVASSSSAPATPPGHPSPHAMQPGPVPPVAPPAPFAEHAAPIEFTTVAAARAALATREGAVATSDASGWTVVSEDRTQTLWSFAPDAHPAHPAVVRRQLVHRDGVLYIEMEVLCEGPKPACNRLEVEFEALNARARDDIVAAQKYKPARKS